jgi:translation initiation factor IF-3
MNSTTCLWNSRYALYRTFIYPLERREISSIGLRSRPSRICLPATRSFSVQSIKNSGANSNANGNGNRNGNGRVGAPGTSARDRPPQDHEITDRWVMVVNEDKKLEGPYRTVDLLARLGLTAETLRVVVPRDPGNKEQPNAICRIINKKAEFEAQRARKEKERLEKVSQKKGIGKTKTLELNWAISAHDLQHKMKNLRDFLEKGYKVEVLLAKKKRSRAATAEECKALVESVQEAVKGVPGAKEWKSSDGIALKSMTFFFQGPAKSDA